MISIKLFEFRGGIAITFDVVVGDDGGDVGGLLSFLLFAFEKIFVLLFVDAAPLLEGEFAFVVGLVVALFEIEVVIGKFIGVGDGRAHRTPTSHRSKWHCSIRHPTSFSFVPADKFSPLITVLVCAFLFDTATATPLMPLKRLKPTSGICDRDGSTDAISFLPEAEFLFFEMMDERRVAAV